MSEPMKTQLMYRPPGQKKHRDITHVLDDILIKLEEFEKRIHELEARTSWQ